MKKKDQKIRLFKEEEKIRQVTHWDLDYLPKDEILDLYKRKTGHLERKNGIGHAIDKSNQTQTTRRRFIMNEINCLTEKYSSRVIGLIILPLALALGFLGFLIVPVVGLIFSVPLFILAFTFIAAPESKVCRLILRKDSTEG